MAMSAEMQERLTSLGYTAFITFFFLAAAYRLNFFGWKREGEFAELKFQEVLGAFFTFILIQLVLAPLAMTLYYYFLEKKSLVDLKHLDAYSEAWLGIFNNTLLLIGLGIYCIPLREKVRSFFGSKLRLNDFLVGVFSWFVAMPVASVLGELIDTILSLFRANAVDQTAVQHLKQTASYPLLFSVTAIMVITVVPLIEELLFRGFLQTWLKQKMNLTWAIVVTSAIFALFHFSASQSYDNFLILTILFTVSCFMGFVYERQKSLLASIGLHAAFNAVTTFSIFFSKLEG